MILATRTLASVESVMSVIRHFLLHARIHADRLVRSLTSLIRTEWGRVGESGKPLTILISLTGWGVRA